MDILDEPRLSEQRADIRASSELKRPSWEERVYICTCRVICDGSYEYAKLLLYHVSPIPVLNKAGRPWPITPLVSLGTTTAPP